MSFSRFLLWILLVLEGLSLAVVIGFLYVVLDRLITQDYQHHIEIQATEIQSLLIQRSTFAQARIDEIVTNNGVGISLLLGLFDKAEELMQQLYPPVDGASYFLRHPSGHILPTSLAEPALLENVDIDAIENPLPGWLSIHPSMIVFAKPVQRSGKTLGHVIGVYNIAEDSVVAAKVDAYQHVGLVARINDRYVNLARASTGWSPGISVDLRPVRACAGMARTCRGYWIPLSHFPNLFIAASDAPLVKKRRDLIAYLVMLCLPLFGLTLTVSFLILKKVTSSINALVRNAMAIAEAGEAEELDEARVQCEEFLQLAQAFNKVLAKVRCKTLELKQHQFHLDQLVEERTAELSASNHMLRQTQAQMIQSEKMASIGQLAAGVAHEINNPIGFVHSNLNTLKEFCREIKSLLMRYEELESAVGADAAGHLPVRDLLENIRQCKELIEYDYVKEEMECVLSESSEGVERVARIVKDLNDFAHPNAGSVDYMDINRGIESTLNIVWAQLKHNVVVNKDFGELPLVKCDANKMNQVFMNLLINAGQAIEREGIIDIRTRCIDRTVEIVVKDNGCGITTEAKSKIFDPFFTTKEVGCGTGLGLNLVYNIVKGHNGTIEVESEVGVGSAFTIRLHADGGRIC